MNPTSPPHKISPFFIGACIVFAAVSARANVALGPIFRDGAVLQRDKPLPVWGSAAPGERIRVSFHGQTAETTADPAGRWRVVLPAQPASSEPSELDVAGNDTVRVSDVVVGDVWLCGGQSNMEFSVARPKPGTVGYPGGVKNLEEEVASARYPLIRQLKVPHTVADRPAGDVAGTWVACSPSTVGLFTAVGYFFARDLQRQTHVPIGLINDNWGGTQIESWMSDDTLRADASAGKIFERWRNVLDAYPAKWAAYQAKVARLTNGEPRSRPPLGPGSQLQPSGLYNAMIHPFLPAAIRGILWYQGEANAASDERAAEYRSLFPELIRQWRRDFGQGDLPFYFVQLADYGPKATGNLQNWAILREAQADALALPNTGMAVTIDIGNPDNVHPTDKQDVGRRLALWARSRLLGEKVEYSGPVFESVRRDGANLVVSFSHAEGLRVRGEPTSFEIAGADGKFVPATATVAGATLIVTDPYRRTPAPVAVRYAWRNVPMACLYNGAGLPAAPFRSDR